MTNRNKLATTDDHEHHNHHEKETDEEEIAVEVFPAYIFDAVYCGEEVPAGFDAVRILLDGSIKSDLSWKEEREAAQKYVAQGYRLFWELNIGIPGSLPHSLSHRPQFLSLALSLDHFHDTLWKEFRNHNMGLCLYRGSPDFTSGYPWDSEQIHNFQSWLMDLFQTIEVFVKETGIDVANFSLLTPELFVHSERGRRLVRLFCRNAIAEYLTLLCGRLSDALPLFLLFDIQHEKEPIEAAQLMTKELYSRFMLGLKSGFSDPIQMLDGDFSWGEMRAAHGGISRDVSQREGLEIAEARVGLCLPRASACLPSHMQLLQGVSLDFYKRNIPFRIIPQNDLAAKWQGLDELVVVQACVDNGLERQLRGFRAAGGNVRSLMLDA